ncbi:Hypothetical protein D9617_13g098750 [Elsinoe fawcettii]|nr:Hypothetical protein D9617_13g098750 [Elsinoe fawcettii]
MAQTKSHHGLTPGESISTAPKPSKPSKKPTPGNKSAQGSSDAITEADRRRETARAANQALKLQRQAEDLTQAAAGAGDPQERQKLLNEALNKSVEAESFGKTAKYLQSGAFQGLLAGGGLGTGFGAGLGAITGTLVGGVSSVIFGGLGGGIGTAVGAIHGPWFKVGDAMGAGIRKITGDWPGWEATEEQKYQLEKMVGQAKETERPSVEELEGMTAGDGADGAFRDLTGLRKTEKGWGESAKGLLPPSWTKKQSKLEDFGTGPVPTDSKGKEEHKRDSGNEKRPTSSDGQAQATKKKPRKLETRSRGADHGNNGEQTGTSVTPQKQESRNTSAAASRRASVDGTEKQKRQPRKLNSTPRPQPKTAASKG